MGYLKNLNHLHLQNYTTHDDILIAFGVFIPRIVYLFSTLHNDLREIGTYVYSPTPLCSGKHTPYDPTYFPSVRIDTHRRNYIYKKWEYLFIGCNIISADIILLRAACCNFPQYLQVILSEADNGPDSSVGCVITSKATY